MARTYVNFPPTPGGGFSLDGGSRTWIWDLSRKRARLPLSQYGTGLALSADGKFLATGWGTRLHMGRLNICTSGPAKGIHLWEVDSGKEVLHFTVPEDEATVLALSPDGTKLVAGHKSGTDRSRSGQHLKRRALNRRFGPVVRTGRGEPMSQQDALLAAVRADPDDDTARLAYADWLEETGGADESRRAEFIRVQIERARLPPDDPRQSGLEARERRLMVPHALDWVGPLAGRCRPWAFRRGFLDGVTLDPRTFAADAPALFAAHPVRALRLTGWPAQADAGPSARDLAEQIAGRPELARVRRLALGENIPFDEAPAGSLVAVVSSLHLTGLTELAVGHDFLPAEDLAVLPTLPVVARLDALDLPVGACPSAALAGLADAAVNLRRLRLALGEDVTPAGLGAFLASPLAARLTDLELRAGGGLFRWDAVPGLAELLPRPRLRRLALVGPGPAPVAALTAAPSWGAVSSLSLARCRLPPAAWGALLACPHLAGLTELDLRGTGVTDRQVEELAACPRLANLTRLDLSSCPVRDRGARALAGSPFLRRLTDLSLNSVGLTDAGATALVGSANLADLRRLDLRGHDIGGLTLEALAGSPHLGRLTTLLFAGRGWAGDDAVLALAGSANLPCLTLIDRLNISEYWSTEEGIQALLDARALTWPGLAEHDLRTDAQRAAFADRFRGVYWPPLLGGGLGAGW